MSVQELVRVAPEALVVEGMPPEPPPPATGPISPTKERGVEVVTAADVLERAADLLGEFGWCQGTDGSKEAGTMCARGAAYAAGEDFGISRQVANEMLYEHTQFPVAAWNDAPERTAAEVVAKLRQAARRARGQELFGGHGLGAVPRSAGDQ